MGVVGLTRNTWIHTSCLLFSNLSNNIAMRIFPKSGIVLIFNIIQTILFIFASLGLNANESRNIYLVLLPMLSWSMFPLVYLIYRTRFYCLKIHVILIIIAFRSFLFPKHCTHHMLGHQKFLSPVECKKEACVVHECPQIPRFSRHVLDYKRNLFSSRYCIVALHCIFVIFYPIALERQEKSLYFVSITI